MLAATAFAHLGAGIAAQVTVTEFDRSVLRYLLQHTELTTDGVTNITVAAKAWRFLSQLGQTRRRATEQLGAAAYRVEQIVAAQQVFLTQFNAIVRARHVVVGGVVATLAVLLTEAYAVGVVTVDGAGGVRVVEVVVQRVGLVNLVAGLAEGQAGEIEVVSAWAAILALITVNASNSLLKVMGISSFTVLFGYGARLLTSPVPPLNRL